MTADVVLEKTEKGKKYILDTARVSLVAYQYAWHTRYFMKKPYETRYKHVNASFLREQYPVTFSILRSACGLRKYGTEN